MELSDDEALVLDTLEVAGRFSCLSGAPAFLSDWASRLIDRGFVGPEVSTLWLDAYARYPDQLHELSRAVLKEEGLFVEFADADLRLIETYLRIRRVMARPTIEVEHFLSGAYVRFEDKRLQPLADIMLEAEVDLFGNEAAAGIAIDGTRIEQFVRERCIEWVRQVRNDVAPYLSQVERVLSCPR